MRKNSDSKLIILAAAGFLAFAAFAAAQTATAPDPKAVALRGAYGPFRANNDLLSYDLDIRVDPEAKAWSGKNTIRFRMLKEDARIQLDL
ncbi:MAG: M1 family metallopeptidase, partial [Acidobacteria bacterium]|nr:M1 family metallopeptidase [Acidobacteriota bacterium]